MSASNTLTCPFALIPTISKNEIAQDAVGILGQPLPNLQC